MLDFDKFTNYSQEILSSASALMSSYQNSQMEPEHIMLAMIKDDGIIKDYLTELKILNQNFINKVVSKLKVFQKYQDLSTHRGYIYQTIQEDYLNFH